MTALYAVPGALIRCFASASRDVHGCNASTVKIPRTAQVDGSSFRGDMKEEGDVGELVHSTTFTGGRFRVSRLNGTPSPPQNQHRTATNDSILSLGSAAEAQGGSPAHQADSRPRPLHRENNFLCERRNRWLAVANILRRSIDEARISRKTMLQSGRGILFPF